MNEPQYVAVYTKLDRRRLLQRGRHQLRPGVPAVPLVPGDLLTQVRRSSSAISDEKQTALGHRATSSPPRSSSPIRTTSRSARSSSVCSSSNPAPDARNPSIRSDRPFSTSTGWTTDEVLRVKPRPPAPTPAVEPGPGLALGRVAPARAAVSSASPTTAPSCTRRRMRTPHTQGMDYDYVVASGTGHVVLATQWSPLPAGPVVRLPELIVGLVELDEGVRLISNIVAVKPRSARASACRSRSAYVDTHDDVTLHQFRPAATHGSRGRRHDPGRRSQWVIELPLKCPIPLDPRLIVSTAHRHPRLPGRSSRPRRRSWPRARRTSS